MSKLRKKDVVVAILVSDLHLSLSAPAARSSESSWLSCMARALEELEDLSTHHVAPIICAGDVFDKWNPSTELVNWAIKHLPMMYAIPGQHDLPLHRYEDKHKSAYWTLVETGNIKDLQRGKRGDPVNVKGKTLWIYPFPWGRKIAPCPHKFPGSLHLAVCHSFIWNSSNPKTGYTGAPAKCSSKSLELKLDGYDVALFGDNHIGFLIQPKNGTVIYNNGTFMRRRISDINYRPHVGLLTKEGAVRLHELHSPHSDSFVGDPTLPGYLAEADRKNMRLEFLKELQTSGDNTLSFQEAVKRYFTVHKTPKHIREIITSAIDG